MASDTPLSWNLRLLGCWSLERDGRPVAVALRQQRLISVLALKGGRRRSHIAGLLWPSCTDAQASGSLRAGLWNIAHRLPDLLGPLGDSLALAPGVSVDVGRLLLRMDLVNRGAAIPAGIADEVRDADLLPGWDEQWLWSEQERLDRLRLVTLEALAHRFLAEDRLDDALDSATAAARLDPLRESAQRLLLRIHLAAGNNASAARAYQSYLLLLRRECGVPPSASIQDLVRPLHLDLQTGPALASAAPPQR